MRLPRLSQSFVSSRYGTTASAWPKATRHATPDGQSRYGSAGHDKGCNLRCACYNSPLHPREAVCLVLYLCAPLRSRKARIRSKPQHRQQLQ